MEKSNPQPEVIQLKDLSKEHLEYAINKIKSVKLLKRTSAPINTIRGYTIGGTPNIIGGLLTLRSSWVIDNKEENLKNNINNLTKASEEQIDFICCLSVFVCAIEHIPEQSEFHGTPIKLLRMLQDLGNIPAIEYDKYGIKGIDPKIIN